MVLSARKGEAKLREMVQITGDPRTGGGQVVADNGAVGAGGEAAVLFLAQLLPAAGHADHRVGIDEAEQGHRGQDLVHRQRLQIGQRRALNGGEDVDRDRFDRKLAQLKGHVESILHGLAHADDAARTERHAGLAGQAQGFDLFLPGMGGTHLGKIGAARLQVAVVAPHPGRIQIAGDPLVKKTGRGAEQHRSGLGHLLIEVSQLGHRLRRQAAAAGDQRNAMHAVLVVVPGLGQGFLLGNHGIGVDTGAVARRLSAESAVLGAVAALGIDDRTEVEVVAAEMTADGIGAAIELLFVAAEQSRRGGPVDLAAGENRFCGLVYDGVHNVWVP